MRIGRPPLGERTRVAPRLCASGTRAQPFGDLLAFEFAGCRTRQRLEADLITVDAFLGWQVNTSPFNLEAKQIADVCDAACTKESDIGHDNGVQPFDTSVTSRRSIVIRGRQGNDANLLDERRLLVLGFYFLQRHATRHRRDDHLSGHNITTSTSPHLYIAASDLHITKSPRRHMFSYTSSECGFSNRPIQSVHSPSECFPEA